jgi:glucose-6-phosphate isomerase
MLMPICSHVDRRTWRIDANAIHIKRHLSDMKGMYHDREAQAVLEKKNPVIYEVFTPAMPELEGHLAYGTSIVNPGKVGDEFYMTKGHFHQKLETAEVYYCLQGHGYLLMQTPESEVKAVALRPGGIVYVPPRWAHRSINVSADRFVTLFVYPADAGHDYATIETEGFAQLLVHVNGKPTLVDNPKYARGRD